METDTLDRPIGWACSGYVTGCNCPTCTIRARTPLSVILADFEGYRVMRISEHLRLVGFRPARRVDVLEGRRHG